MSPRSLMSVTNVAAAPGGSMVVKRSLAVPHEPEQPAAGGVGPDHLAAVVDVGDDRSEAVQHQAVVVGVGVVDRRVRAVPREQEAVGRSGLVEVIADDVAVVVLTERCGHRRTRELDRPVHTPRQNGAALDAVGVEVLEQDVAPVVDAAGLGERRARRLGDGELTVLLAHKAAQGQAGGSGSSWLITGRGRDPCAGQRQRSQGGGSKRRHPTADRPDRWGCHRLLLRAAPARTRYEGFRRDHTIGLPTPAPSSN